MNATILMALLFAILLWLEWRFRLRSMRVAAALLALVVLFFSQPDYTRAARQAIVMPSAERVTEVRGSQLTAYASGVRTMEHVVGEDSNAGANARLLAIGILFWLGCSPALPRRYRTPKGEESPLHLEEEIDKCSRGK